MEICSGDNSCEIQNEYRAYIGIFLILKQLATIISVPIFDFLTFLSQKKGILEKFHLGITKNDLKSLIVEK